LSHVGCPATVVNKLALLTVDPQRARHNMKPKTNISRRFVVLSALILLEYLSVKLHCVVSVYMGHLHHHEESPVSHVTNVVYLCGAR
jgi:hypothetical protein